MASTTITFHVEDAERIDLVVRAEREKISLSDYIRVRLGLRGQGSQDDAEIGTDPELGVLEGRLIDHERRLHALEDASRLPPAGPR